MMSIGAISSAEPRTRRWTAPEYYRMADLGFFRGQNVELIDGEIIEMAPQRNAHVFCVTKVADALRQAFGPDHWVRVEAPLDLDPHFQPEPDVAVVEGPPHAGADHPKSALLVVEVSDTTLRFDRVEKSSLYARHGIAEYWIVNLVDELLEVHRGPAADVTQRYGASYAAVTVLKRGQTVSPSSRHEAVISVADLLP